MPPTLKNRKILLIITLLIILALATIGVLFFLNKNGDQVGSDNSQNISSSSADTNPPKQASETMDVQWENTSEGGWLALSTPSTCPEPFTLQSPSDLMKATSLLYPGQERKGDVFSGAGGNYKPHGGFRFDGLKLTDVKVASPVDGYVYRGSRYLIKGEIQYTFDLIHSCGYMIRLGHLRELSPTFQTYADKFPPAAEEDSRTERVAGFPKIKAGDIIATAVGLPPSNTFFDLGVYDLRKQNEVSKTPAYQQAHADAKELAYYAVCWLDMLPKDSSSFIKNLPAGDPQSGKTSDYCK